MAGQATESERKIAGVTKQKKLCSEYPQSDGIRSESARKSSGSVKTSVLATAVTNGSWETWKRTSRFIVNSYHYNNHRVQDYLCRTFCNPAPANDVAPNLVIVEYDENGQPYGHRAFNTQVCEQLNSWLGGYQSIAKLMTPGNFNWFIHVMLFYHTKYTINKQKRKSREEPEGDIGLDEDTEEESDEE
jgi:hypothetical protein